MEKDETRVSLYDYRGRPDHDGKGQDIYKTSKERGVAYETREVDTPKYKGKVIVYPKWFLDEYFTSSTPPTQKQISTYDSSKDSDDLPF